MDANYKEVIFIGQTKEILSAMPDQVRDDIGHALYLAQVGLKDLKAKPLTGRKEFRGSKVLEIVSDHDTNTYRGVYTVEHAEGIYVVDVFQKKSKHGIQTPKEDIDRIVRRLKRLDEVRATAAGQAQIAELKRRWTVRQAEIDKRKSKDHEPH